MHRGNVVFFDPRPEKRFGFLEATIRGKTETVFFHLSAGFQVRVSGYAMIRDRPVTVEPKTGDELTFGLVFARYRGRPVLRAVPWHFAGEYDVALEAIRKATQMFRYCEIADLKLGRKIEKGEPYVVWEGRNVAELDEVVEAKRLGEQRRFKVSEGPTMIVWGFFEHRTPEGSWESCMDPRLMVGAGIAV